MNDLSPRQRQRGYLLEIPLLFVALDRWQHFQYAVNARGMSKR